MTEPAFVQSMSNAPCAHCGEPLEPGMDRCGSCGRKASADADRRGDAGGSSLERPCPFCGESVKRTAVICRFCRSSLVTLPSEPHGTRGGNLLGIVGLVLALVGWPVLWWSWIPAAILFLAAVLVGRTARANREASGIVGVAQATAFMGLGASVMLIYFNVITSGWRP